MANPIITTFIPASKMVISTSRYSRSKVIHYGVDNKITFTIYRREDMGFSPYDKYYEIEPKYEFRPDELSRYFYGVPDYWWKLMEMNGMKDILEFRTGRNIRIPGGTIM